jgi:hypothetical protein
MTYNLSTYFCVANDNEKIAFHIAQNRLVARVDSNNIFPCLGV